MGTYFKITKEQKVDVLEMAEKLLDIGRDRGNTEAYEALKDITQVLLNTVDQDDLSDCTEKQSASLKAIAMTSSIWRLIYAKK